jgi:hypothetical protein
MSVKYSIISPVRNKDKLAVKTIKGFMHAVTTHFKRFIICDGLNGNTESIIQSYCYNNQWIELINLPDGRFAISGSRTVETFNKGLVLIQKLEFDHLVKPDRIISAQLLDFFNLQTDWEEHTMFYLSEMKFIRN